jgi:hypothetical protein
MRGARGEAVAKAEEGGTRQDEALMLLREIRDDLAAMRRAAGPGEAS